MEWLSFSRGELRRNRLNQYINQGSFDINQFAALVAEVTEDNEENYRAEIVCTLPNQQTVTVAGIWTTNVVEFAGENYDGYLFTLPHQVTIYAGAVLVALRIVDTVNNTVLVNYPFTLIVNETGVKPDTDTGVTIEQLDSYLSLVQNWIDDASEEFGAKLYVHHFDVVLTDNDLDMLPSGTQVHIHVNAISNDGNEWATLEELDGGGYILSAFGQIVLPTPLPSPIFELKLFNKDYGNGALLLQVNDLSSNTISCVMVTGKNTFALQDSVSAIN